MAPEPKPSVALSAASVIVIEDHTFVRELVQRMLKGRVNALHGAASAEDALYNLEQNPGLAHVAIIDYHLPGGMSGLKFIEKLRTSKIPALRRLPVVMLTRENSMDLYRSAAKCGIAAFLMKPVAITTLVDALEGALAGRRAGSPRPTEEPVPAQAEALVKVKKSKKKTEADSQAPARVDFKT